MNIDIYRKYSVLMSVYIKEKAEHLQMAIESMQMQTLPTDDFILICDGPLTPELNQIIEKKQRELGAIFRVIRLKKNNGLGKALSIGINYCKNELVARMDSDDIAYPDRCERQINVFRTYPDISVCSGTVEEFLESPAQIEARRILPETHTEIINFAKKRNPFNHPCVMYKKSAVQAVGSYQDFYLLEDYYLWIRMLLAGYHGYNLQEPLLYMRAGCNMYKRRSGLQYAKSQIALFYFMKESGFINKKELLQNCLIRVGSSLAPNWVREFMFKKFLRK